MTDREVILCSIDYVDMEKIKKILNDCNQGKGTWQRTVNRQAVIRALIKYALKQDLKFESRYSKEVYIVKPTG